MAYKTPDFRALALAELPADEQQSERFDVACDRLHGALVRAHRVLDEHDDELGEYFVRVMTRALRS